MSEHRITIGNLTGHERLQVPHHTGISIFAEHQGCARVTDKDVAQACSDTGVSHHALHVVTNIVSPAPFRRNP